MIAHRPPAVVLFDYGGVLAEVTCPDRVPELACELRTEFSAAGADGLAADVIESDIRSALRAYDGWKTAQSRQRDPVEITARGFWELVAVDWPEQERTYVLAHAVPLTERVEAAVLLRTARPDAANTLRELMRAGVRTGLVCNCLSGSLARTELLRDSLLDLLAVQVFSDEVGYRKPGRRIVDLAMTALGGTVESTWFVGDKWNRDILAARRAGLAKVVLMKTTAGPGTQLPGVTADHEIGALSELPALLDGYT